MPRTFISVTNIIILNQYGGSHVQYFRRVCTSDRVHKSVSSTLGARLWARSVIRKRALLHARVQLAVRVRCHPTPLCLLVTSGLYSSRLPLH